MSKIKQLALKLFAKVYGIKTASTYLVKKQFPKFRASLKDHWEFLILKLLQVYRKQKAQQQRQLTQEQILKMTDVALKEYVLKFGINPNQPRFKLLKEFGIEIKKPDISHINTLTTRKAKRIPEWNGKLGFG